MTDRKRRRVSCASFFNKIVITRHCTYKGWERLGLDKKEILSDIQHNLIAVRKLKNWFLRIRTRGCMYTADPNKDPWKYIVVTCYKRRLRSDG